MIWIVIGAYVVCLVCAAILAEGVGYRRGRQSAFKWMEDQRRDMLAALAEAESAVIDVQPVRMKLPEPKFWSEQSNRIH